MNRLNAAVLFEVLLASLALVACGSSSSAVPDSSRQGSADPEIVRAKSEISAAPALGASRATLKVPSKKYPTIEAALAAAKSGNVIRVAPGVYQECPVLVDGVTLVGQPGGSLDGGQPGATLDGTSCGLNRMGVVSADASVVHGATLEGFIITGASYAGVYMNRARGVHVRDVTLSGTAAFPVYGVLLVASTKIFIGESRLEGVDVQLTEGSSAVLSELDLSNVVGKPGIFSSQSSVLLENSRIRGSGNFVSVYITQGSKGVLIGNDIQGSPGDGVRVESALTLGDPLSSPSQAWLADNDFHGNTWGGFQVFGKGSWAYGVGNRYVGNGKHGLNVTGGATYVSQRETMTGNGLNGVWSIGCDLRCSDPSCTAQVVIQEQTRVTLVRAFIDGNSAEGVFGGCNAQVTLRSSTVSHNAGAGGLVNALFVFDPIHQASQPSRLDAERTTFAANGRNGVTAINSQLELGTLESPGRNSFFGNAFGSIRNASTNHVNAQLNWFGTTDPAAIAASIFDCARNPAFGCVTYEPFLTSPPQVCVPTVPQVVEASPRARLDR